MSEVLQLGGRSFVVGLYWTEPGAEVARDARKERAWTVDWRDQTGWVAKAEGVKGVDGVPSLAVLLAVYVGGGGGEDSEAGWIALLEADDGRFAVVRVREGMIVVGSDQVLDEEAEAEELVAIARAEGAEVYATAGKGSEGGLAYELDVESLAEEVGVAALRRRSGGGSGLRVAGLSAAFVLILVGGVWVMAPDFLMGLLGGADEAAAVVAVVEVNVSARINSVSLVRECGEAQVVWPPYMPAWEILAVECYGWFDEVELVGLRPELYGRGVMVVRWQLPGHYVAAIHRRIAEEHLAGWYLASVVETSAWAVVPLGVVLGSAEGERVPSYLEFRREVDRHLGMQGGSISYEVDGGVVSVIAILDHALGRIGEIVDAIPGFELVSLSRDGGRKWVLRARVVGGFEVVESRFIELATHVRQGHAKAF